MYYIDMPSAEEIGDLNLVRADACISIYLPTTPVSRETEQSRINLGNLVKKAVTQLEAAGFGQTVWQFWQHRIHCAPIAWRISSLLSLRCLTVSILSRYCVQLPSHMLRMFLLCQKTQCD